MRLPHCVAFFDYIPWFVDFYGKKSFYFENAMQCGKRMQKSDVATWLYFQSLDDRCKCIWENKEKFKNYWISITH